MKNKLEKFIIIDNISTTVLFTPSSKAKFSYAGGISFMLFWKVGLLRTLSNIMASMIARERKGSIGNLIKSSPILVTLSDFGSKAAIKMSNSKDLLSP